MKTSNPELPEAIYYWEKKKWGQISDLKFHDLSLWREAYQTLPKALDISNAIAGVVPEMLKVQAILSDTTVRRSAVDREDLKPHWKSEKKATVL